MEKLKTNELPLGLDQTFRNDLIDNFETIQDGVDNQNQILLKEIETHLGGVRLQDQNEVSQARIDKDGKNYETLKSRIDDTQSTAETSLEEERRTKTEVESARTNNNSKTYESLKKRLDEQENDLTNNMNYKISQISSIPETFSSLVDLKNAYPNGRTGIFVTADTGHKYIWSNNVWNDAGVYQSVGIADHAITNAQIGFNAIQGNLVLSGGNVDYDTTNNTMTIAGGASNYVEFGNQKFPFSGKQVVTNSVDKATRFRLVYDTTLNAFSSLGWQDDVASNFINLGVVYISEDESGAIYYTDNFKFNVRYNGKQAGSAEKITRANIATNGMIPNINTATSAIEFPPNGLDSSINIDVFGQSYWINIPASGLNVSYSALDSTGILLIFNTVDSTLSTDIIDNIGKYSHNFKYGIVAKIRIIGDISIDWGIKYTVNGKLFNNVIDSSQINPADVKMLSTDNFEFSRSAFYRGFNNYEFLALENGSVDANGKDVIDTATVRTPLLNMISLINIGILLFSGTKYAYKIVEYKSDNSYSKDLTDFTTSSNSVINLNSDFKYRLVIKTSDNSTIDISDAKANVKVVNNTKKNDYELGALQPYMQERQLVIAGNFRPYFYRTSDIDIAVVLPPRPLYYYFGNGTKYIQLPSTFNDQVFNLPSDSVLIWDLNSNSIVVQKVYAQRNFNSVVLANNLYGNITNGYFEKYWSEQTQNVRGYKQNFQDILSKKDVTGVDNLTSQGMAQVGSQLWVGNSSTDDHSTETIGQIYKFDSELNKVGRFVHNLGHLNSMDYNSETDTLITSNTSDNTTSLSEIILVQGVTGLQLDESWPLINYNQSYVVKIPLGVNNIGGGPIFGENKNVVYFMCGQYYGTYKIQKYYLGTGSNDLSTSGIGTYISGKNDNEYNGTAKLLGEFYGPTMEVGQDATYFNGNIYGTFGRKTGKIYKLELNQATSTEVQGTYALKEAWVLPNYNSNGANVSSEAEGTVIWNNQYLRTWFQNKIVDIPIFNRQFGKGTVGWKVYYDFKSSTEKNISITPTSDAADIYVSQKDDDGFLVSSKSGADGTFDWSCNL
ncbi:hypothetical protein H2O60_04950 [Leuconostoc mesenteroides]|uniref:hypothetical protein n=1 Tax=Leuconostoc mesenteroides TaxID=1245 RepID=UPI0015F39149|nr:hypothetical protein [Leuconostoc mesenteroides]MBA5972496.1 hypothetical protein [Leuconostoc mesenteroides]